MTRILFVQGAGQGAHDEDARLVASLERELGPEYGIRYPRVPNEESPDDAVWLRLLAEELADVGDDAFIVGHSAGASMVLAWIAQSRPPERIAGLFLIGTPFFGEGGWQVDGFESDLSGLPDDLPVRLYHGREDAIVPFDHLALLANALPAAKVRALDRRDHQLNNDLSEVAADIRALGQASSR